MKITCPTNAEHRRFLTSQQVTEDAVFNEDGDWLETKAVTDVFRGPDPDNIWVCEACGEEAEVER